MKKSLDLLLKLDLESLNQAVQHNELPEDLCSFLNQLEIDSKDVTNVDPLKQAENMINSLRYCCICVQIHRNNL